MNKEKYYVSLAFETLQVDTVCRGNTITPRWKVFVPSIKWQLLRGNRHFPHPWFFGELGGEIIIFDENKTKKNVHNLYIDLLYSR